jgi:hypothetical protein
MTAGAFDDDVFPAIQHRPRAAELVNTPQQLAAARRVVCASVAGAPDLGVLLAMIGLDSGGDGMSTSAGRLNQDQPARRSP